MSGRLSSLFIAAFAAFALTCLSEETATAAEPAAQSVQGRAALAYDSGVHAYEQADYALAARRFLEADAIAPNDDARRNALVAAKRSDNPALVRAAAERVLARPHEDTALVSEAQAALGALPAERTVDVVSSSGPAPSPVPGPPLLTPTSGVTTDKPPSAPVRDATRPWARPAFYSGVALTAALTGLTIWSGLDTLAERRRLPGTQADNDAVIAHAHRTDALLAGTLLAAAGTLYVGIAWVDWGAGPKPVRMAAQLSPTRALVALRGSF